MLFFISKNVYMTFIKVVSFKAVHVADELKEQKCSKENMFHLPRWLGLDWIDR